MKLTVKRFEYGTNYTVGRLYINDEYFCYTLEDKFREQLGVPVEKWKIKDETAIPTGSYEFTITPSTRFGKDLPEILHVPGFSGIRIHSGNTDANTSGCILVGDSWAGIDFVGGSRFIFEKLFKQIRDAIAFRERMVIEIV